MGGKIALTVGLAIGAVLGAGSWALASVPDASNVVHTCYQNVTSANKPVKLLDTAKSATCPSGWKPASWNQQGPAGTPGISSAYYSGQANGSVQLDTANGNWVTVATLTLPAGNWMVTAKGAVGYGQEVQIAVCELWAPVPQSGLDIDQDIPTPAKGMIPFALMEPFSSNSSFNVFLQCAVPLLRNPPLDANASASSNYGRISAVQVGSLHQIG